MVFLLVVVRGKSHRSTWMMIWGYSYDETETSIWSKALQKPCKKPCRCSSPHFHPGIFVGIHSRYSHSHITKWRFCSSPRGETYGLSMNIRKMGWNQWLTGFDLMKNGCLKFLLWLKSETQKKNEKEHVNIHFDALWSSQRSIFMSHS